MPRINLAQRLLSPYIAGEAFTVIRRRQVVNQYGEATTGNAVFTVRGSVTPTGDNSLTRADAYQTQGKTIRVITQFRLRGLSADAAGTAYQPDLIWWGGDYYVLKILNDWSSYGFGMVEAECSSIDYGDQPPHRLPGVAGAVVFSSRYNSELIPCC